MLGAAEWTKINCKLDVPSLACLCSSPIYGRFLYYVLGCKIDITFAPEHMWKAIYFTTTQPYFSWKFKYVYILSSQVKIPSWTSPKRRTAEPRTSLLLCFCASQMSTFSFSYNFRMSSWRQTFNSFIYFRKNIIRRRSALTMKYWN